jgi:predicted enzyme related to lactoylglutathione lyase
MRAEAVIYVKDLARMVAFYEQCFGFALAGSGARHARLESEAWTLQLVAVPAEVGARISIAVPPRRRADVPLKLVFEVTSIDAAAAQLSRLGGQLDDDETRWSFSGYVRCDAVDPEGNVIQLREPRDSGTRG